MNKFIFLFILLFTALLHGQTPPQPAEITLIDGSLYEGFADITKKEEIEFRFFLEDEPETLNETEVKRLAFINYPNDIFEYVKINKRHKLLQLVCQGKMNLYAQYPESFATQKKEIKVISVPSFNADGTFSIGHTTTNTFGNLKLRKERFWIKKSNSDAPEDIKSSFKFKVSKTFHNCPELIGYVNSGEWNYSDLILIVEFYNDFCAVD